MPPTVLTPELLQPVERVDAIVSGPSSACALAEELAALEPCGIGNPGARLLVPGRTVRRSAADGRGPSCALLGALGGSEGACGRVRLRRPPRGRAGRARRRDLPARAQRLERARRAAARAPPRAAVRAGRRSRCSASPSDYLAGRARGARSGARSSTPDAPVDGARHADRARPPRREPARGARRRASPAAAPVLALCADVPRRLDGLRERAGGFALACHHALERDPALASAFRADRGARPSVERWARPR